MAIIFPTPPVIRSALADKSVNFRAAFSRFWWTVCGFVKCARRRCDASRSTIAKRSRCSVRSVSRYKAFALSLGFITNFSPFGRCSIIYVNPFLNGGSLPPSDASAYSASAPEAQGFKAFFLVRSIIRSKAAKAAVRPAQSLFQRLVSSGDIAAARALCGLSP